MKLLPSLHPWSGLALGLVSSLALSAAAQAQSPVPAAAMATPAAKTFIDYFLPTPIIGSMSKDAWGVPGVLPRDQKNGLEDPTVKQYNYWDGQIIKGPDGRYHLFASRWDAVKGHNGGWGGSVAVGAISDNLYGPYIEKGMLWPDNQGGKGHNVTALVMPDGTYAVVVSETRPGDVFTSKSLDGPWTQLGTITLDPPGRGASNYSIMARPEGGFEIVPRSGQILISKTSILGPYKVMGSSVYPSVDGLPLQTLEDPVVWFSGGLYHIVVNGWSPRKAYHLTSKDGITNWTFRGLAYDPTTNFVHFTDGTVNHWNNMERPGVYLENGHIVAMTLAVIDVSKNADRTNDGHGSKVIVIPFDGAALDRDLENAPTPPPVAVPFHPGGNGGRGGRRGGQPSAAAPVLAPTPAAAAPAAPAPKPAPAQP